MKTTWYVLLTISIVLCGCVSKARHRLEVREAFVAGQQQAMSQMRSTSTTDVIVHGNVRNSMIPWKEDMTLIQAIGAAEYLDKQDPKVILLHRSGEVMRINPRELLGGHDIPVRAGDVIDFVK
jgi:hypothetical protein